MGAVGLEYKGGGSCSGPSAALQLGDGLAPAQSRPLGAALLDFVGNFLQVGLGRESQDPGTLKPYTCLVQSSPVHTASAPPTTLPRLQPRSC